MKLVFATENPGKLREISSLAQNFNIEVLSPSQAGLEPCNVEETGSTYEENAALKVRAYSDQSKGKEFIVCGDDAGIELTALNGEPGLHTRRWLGYPMMDQEIACYALGRMHEKDDRTAVFKSVVAYSIRGGNVSFTHGELPGALARAAFSDAPRQDGFPFRRLFLVDADPPIPLWQFEDIPFVERQKRNLFSHRERAFIELFELLKKAEQ